MRCILFIGSHSVKILSSCIKNNNMIVHSCTHKYICEYMYAALAVYARSPAAYNSLRSFRLLQLPSTSVLQQYKSTYTEKAGEIETRLKEESEIYQQRQKEAKEKGWLVPLREVSLIFDEVKVTAKLQWNSRDNSLIGYAMTSDEMASMTDVYQSIDKDAKVPRTDYIMQTMWRDHSSNCDIIGHTTPAVVA